MGFAFHSESASVPTGIASGGAALHIGEYVLGWFSNRNRDNRSKSYNARPWWTKPVIVTLMAADTYSGKFTVLGLEAFGCDLINLKAKDSDRVRFKAVGRFYVAARSWSNMFRFHSGRDEAGSLRVAGLCVELGMIQKEGK